MKPNLNRILALVLIGCAVSVFVAGRSATMWGQEKVTAPVAVAQTDEPLPARESSSNDASEPPVVFDETRGVKEIPQSQTRQSVLRPQLDEPPVFQSENASPATDEELPVREADSAAPAEKESAEAIPVDTTFRQSLPVVVADSHCCEICGQEACTICCQPKCITKTILVPQFRTVWSSMFETRYRTEIREEAYTVEREVDHQEPRIVTETVMVAEPRIRTFQDFREEIYQEPVEESYSVIVRKPRERMVPVEREETFRVPSEQKYTVMVPQEKIVTETKYKTIVEKEPRPKRYTVNVEKQRKRVVIDYVESERTVIKREPWSYVKKIPRTREEWRYRNEIEVVTVKEPYVHYEEMPVSSPTRVANVVKKNRKAPVSKVIYEDDLPQTKIVNETEQVLSANTQKIPQTYTVAVPYTVKAYENFTRSEPYQEEVTFSWKTSQQIPRTIKRKYNVRIPYVENIPRQYEVVVPIQVMKEGKRTIPQQIPQTKYQLIKQDKGRWVTRVSTIPTYEIETDRCGCSTCCPKTRTVRKTVWQPNVVVSRKPYTVFKTVKKEIPFEYPVLEKRTEVRTRMEPVTRYRTEEREVSLTQFESKPTMETNSVKVTKYRQVPDRREVLIQKFREEQRTRFVEAPKYENRDVPKTLKAVPRIPKVVNDTVDEEFTDIAPGDKLGTPIESKIVQGGVRFRDKEVELVKRVAYPVNVPYEEEVTINDFRNVEKVVKVKEPVPRIETYVEVVPEIRTRIEYVDVEKEVPYVETKTITEMVPETRSRTVYKTDVRTVAELKPEIYFEDVRETFTRTVFKKRVRNVPVNRAEIYWVKVPKVLKKTVFKTVKRKIKRPMIRRVPIKVPYQVEVRIPRRVCTMVPQTITIPIEECCEHCTWHLPGVAQATQAWVEYGWSRATQLPSKVQIDNLIDLEAIRRQQESVPTEEEPYYRN